jgi:hypothetical protein
MRLRTAIRIGTESRTCSKYAAFGRLSHDLSVSECRGRGFIIIVFDRFLRIFSAVNVNFSSSIL